MTEEIWSWWRYGSVHRAPWPTVHEVTVASRDPALLRLAGEALTQVRRAKSERKLSMRTEVPLAEVLGPAALLEQLALAADDLRAAGRIGKLDLLPDRSPRAGRRLRLLTPPRLRADLGLISVNCPFWNEIRPRSAGYQVIGQSRRKRMPSRMATMPGPAVSTAAETR